MFHEFATTQKIFLSRISKYAIDERIEGIFFVRCKPANFCHHGRQKRVKVKLSHSVFPILPSVFGLIVFKTKPL